MLSPMNYPGRIGQARIALVTITVEEFDLVAPLFGLTENIPGTPYFANREHGEVWDVVATRADGQTNVISERVAGDFIEDFHPAYLFLVGTAGGYAGRDGIALGDVVVANFIDYSSYWKFDGGRVLPRKNPHDHPSFFIHRSFVERMRVRPQEWQRHITVNRPTAGSSKLHVGNLVSGDILMGDASNPEQQRIVQYFDKALAFEMEAYGVARAVFSSRRSLHYNPQFLIVRGISDFVNTAGATNQADRRRWTDYAVAAAGSVVFEIMRRLPKQIFHRSVGDRVSLAWASLKGRI
jgi:nucleoside phosphorylase